MNINLRIKQRGLTLIELMVAMAIGLVIISVTTLIYLKSNESQKALDRQSSVAETGTFVIQALGRDIKMAGYYPATVPPITTGTAVIAASTAKNSFMAATQEYMYDTYPPIPSNPVLTTDWIAASSVYNSSVFGCDGGNFDTKTGTCPTENTSSPDSLVINWFSSDAMGDSLRIGNRKDCNGADIAGDPVNEERKLNKATSTYDVNLPPKLPIFGSNRYALTQSSTAGTYVDGKKIITYSFACAGNGSNYQGVNGVYQASLIGLMDMQIDYGVYSDQNNLMPAKFYKASEVNGLPSMSINGQDYTGWQRVTAVRVCLISQSIGNQSRIATSTASAPSYIDCKGNSQSMPSGQWIKRDIQVFGVRNNLKMSY